MLPRIDSAFEQNRLSYSKVRALICVATPENEAELCELAEPVAAGRLARVLASWLARHETPAETEQRQRDARSLSWRVRPDGTISGWFRFAPADGAVLIETVDAQVRMRDRFDASADASVPEAQRWPSDAQQRADALVELLADGGASVATEIVLHVRGDGCTLDDGTPVAETVVERLVPEAFLRALIHDANGRPLNASGRHRHPTDRQKRVVKERDRCCRKCGTTEHLQYHHDPSYEQSKHTLVDELWLECRDCHRADHPKRNARRE